MLDISHWRRPHVICHWLWDVTFGVAFLLPYFILFSPSIVFHDIILEDRKKLSAQMSFSFFLPAFFFLFHSSTVFPLSQSSCKFQTGRKSALLIGLLFSLQLIHCTTLWHAACCFLWCHHPHTHRHTHQCPVAADINCGSVFTLCMRIWALTGILFNVSRFGVLIMSLSPNSLCKEDNSAGQSGHSGPNKLRGVEIQSGGEIYIEVKK